MTRNLDVLFQAERVAGMLVGSPYISKLGGDICKATVKFKRKGEAGVAMVFWEIAPGIGWPTRYDWDAGRVMAEKAVTMYADMDWREYTAVLEFAFPKDFPHDRIDCRIRVHTAVTQSGYAEQVLSGVWDDVYAWVKPEYTELSATFT